MRLIRGPMISLLRRGSTFNSSSLRHAYRGGSYQYKYLSYVSNQTTTLFSCDALQLDFSLASAED